jgi:hypothetical protein
MADAFAILLTHPDLIDRMPVSQNFRDTLKAFGRLVTQAGAAIMHVAQLPPSPGYEPLLIKHRCNPIAARGLAALAVRAGARRAKDHAYCKEIRDALRFFTKRRRNQKAIAHNARVLLQACEQRGAIETVLDEAGLDEAEFIRLLQSVAKAQEPVSRRLAEIASALQDRWLVKRGPRVSVVTATHECFLQTVGDFMKERPRAYTWSDLQQDFTDSLTQATRREFNCPNFDPRPAHRRLKARKA